MALVRFLLAAMMLVTAQAQIFGGGGSRMSKEEMAHMEGAPMGEGAVDRAMQEWDTLASE